MFDMPLNLNVDRISQRRQLLDQVDNMRRGLDLSGSMDAMDSYSRQAIDMVIGKRARDAFDIEREPAANRQPLWQTLCGAMLRALRVGWWKRVSAS